MHNNHIRAYLCDRWAYYLGHAMSARDNGSHRSAAAFDRIATRYKDALADI